MKKYDIVEDHAELKKIIKDAERRIDVVIAKLEVGERDIIEIIRDLDSLSNELMAVNM